MPIYNMNDLRAAVPSSMRDLSDDELIRDYAGRVGKSFEDTASYLGFKPRGTLAEMGRQAMGGAVVDLPKMVGQGLEYTGVAPAYGREMAQAAEARAPAYIPDNRGRGLMGEALTMGARGLAPVLSTAPLAFIPGVGTAAAAGAAATLFGTSSAQETYDKLIDQGISEEDAAAAARRVGLIQGPLEGAATAVGLRAFKPLATALRGAPKTTSGVAGALTDTAVSKPFLKGMGVNLAVQPGTEVAQDVGSSMVERAYGAAPEDLGEMAKQSALGGVGLTLLLGPLAFGSHVSRARNAAKLKEALYGDNTPTEVRAQAIDMIMAEAQRQGVQEQDIDKWFDTQLDMEDARTEKLREIEQTEGDKFREMTKGITTEAEPIDLQARIDSLLGITPAQDRMREVDLIGGARAPSEDYISGSRGLLTGDEQLQQVETGKEIAPGIIQSAPGVYYQQPAAPIDLTSPGREPNIQQPAPRRTLSQIRTGMFQTPILNSQQVLAQEEGGPTAAGPAFTPPVDQPAAVSPLGGASTTAPLPAAPVVAGVSSTVPVTKNGAQTPKTVKTKTQGQKPAPAVAPVVAVTVGPKDVSEAIKEDNEIDSVLKAVEAEDQKTDNLFAAVKGETGKAPGKPSMPAQVYAAIRNAIVRPKAGVMVRKAKSVEKDEAATAKYGEKIKQIAEAARNFAETYENYSTQNLVRTGKDQPDIIGNDETADQVVANRAVAMKANANAVRAALAKLGEAVGGNAKDVEAIVRFVKDRAQKERRGDQTYERADIRLSRAWAAAKSESFIGEPDLLATNPNEVRQSRESTARGAAPQLVEAATEGYATFGKGPVETGINGILNYIRTTGTPFEKTLGLAIKRAVAGKRDIKVVFTEDGKGQYDPKTNTITINRTSSREVALHEALHGALQWYVYSNPTSQLVSDLKASLMRVVNFDTAKLPPKAAEVQAVLKKVLAGKSKTAELDAVLELISYGNTLNDFRRALQGMESNAPRTFIKFANDTMELVYALVRRMLGIKQSVASDVMENTFKLLEAARAAEQTAPSTGNVLKAAVETTRSLSDAKVAAALGVTEQDYSRFNKSNAVQLQLLQRGFETVGWSKANMEKLIGKAGDKMREFISKNFPGAEIVLGWINSRYNVDQTVSKVMDRFKLDKGIGYQYAEDLANVISRRPANEVNALFAYLDGDKKALDKLPDSMKMKAVADKLDAWFKLYVKELTPVEQRYFNSRKFSENLLFPERTEQVAGSTFGLGKINEVLGLKRESMTELDQDWFQKDDNGDLVLDGDVYQVFQPNNATPAGGMISAGFISAARFAELNNTNPLGFTVDTSRKWLFEGFKDKKYSFVTNTTAREKIADQKANDVANALRNTIAALANNYASKNFIKSVYGMGRGGSVHAQVAFDNLEQLNKALKTNVLENQVLQVSREISRSPQTKALYRQSGTWVKIPENSPVYGELSGKYLPGPVWNALGDMSDRQPVVPWRATNNIMRWFKKSKTVWNFGTHVTNTASNVTMAMVHDISFSTMLEASQILAKYEANPKSLNKNDLALMMAFRDSGAMLADYSSAEVKEALYKAHAENLRGGEDVSVMRRVAGWLSIEKSKAEFLQKQAAKVGKGVEFMDEVSSQMYAAEDNIFRLAAFLKTAGALQNRAGAKTPTQEMLQEAGLFARKAFGDYDIDSKAVKIGRQTVMPFISWFYAMAPVIGRIAVYEPWKLASVLTAYMILEAAMSGAAGDDDEEKRMEGPESLRERMFGSVGPYTHIRIPFMGDDDNPVYYKLGDYFPTSSFTRGLPNGMAGQSWIPASLTPSGPFVSAVLGIVGGVDPYTGKSLHTPTDTEWQKLWTTTKFAYDTATIPLFNSRNLSKVQDMIDEKTGLTGGEPSSLFIARAFGLKFYDYNADEQAAQNEIIRKRIESDFKTAINKAKRDEYRKGYPDYDELDKTLEDLQVRMEKELAKARGEE
jgi:hypothetical protein